MAIRTYQKRGGGPASRPTPAASAAFGSENVLPRPPPSSVFNGTSKEEMTPPWRRRTVRQGIDEDYDSGDDNEVLTKENLGNTVAAFAQPNRQFLKEFRKGLDEDKAQLGEWISSPVEFNTSSAKCVPAAWPLARQMRFAAWCQLLGLTCQWEGGYLWVLPSKTVSESLGWVYLNTGSQETDALSPLPAAPQPRPTTTVASIEAKLSQLDLSTSSADSVIQEEEEEKATTARNRPRKWQQQSHLDLVRLSANAFDRRSSIGARRSSLDLGGGRRSSIVVGRRTSIMHPVPEEEEAAPEQSLDDVDDVGLLRRILGFLSPSFLLARTTQVSKRWSVVSVSAANARFAQNGGFLEGFGFFRSFPKAKFLAEGAYKAVFQVHNPFTQSDEAVSVMDVNKIAKYGNVSVVAQEVNISLVLSDLVTEGICPNFIETKRVFQLNQSPPWDKKVTMTTGQPFQYIRMELCQGGDLEEHMKTYPGGILPLDESRGVIFQMLYSLYAGRRMVKLRHYDIKCLNFFCKLPDTGKEACDYFYSLGQDCSVRLSKSCRILLKLADYGTADLVEENLGKPIDVCHFTTLENTPMDFLLFPNAVQSFAADTFQTGLAILHVLTGAAPYEEILEAVKCPIALMDAVSNVWEEGKDFDTLRCVLRDDDDNILYHTLYRYLVLFGLPEKREDSKFDPSRSKVFEAISAVLGTSVDLSSKSLKAKNVKQARKQFAVDCAKFSLKTGAHHLIARARDRAKQLGVWDDLLWRCLDYNPQRRVSAALALRSRAFEQWYTMMPKSVSSDGPAAGVFGEDLVKMDEEMERF